MQCLLKKRRLEPQLEPWSCPAKRTCVEAEVHFPECPMDVSHPLPGSGQQEHQQQVRVVQPRPPLGCPRCLGGEPVIKHRGQGRMLT
ncbi:unnamed protein product [Tetraodon nigroviridis]|uniref:(spotted green pufferfish) hypothetical protein n=1 Tax=Tetraodon nigroviridis TaxID=99883 RepID=Q4RHH9_TETNG|nr:unnamed protein product [Tetraodon nigroviridis]